MKNERRATSDKRRHGTIVIGSDHGGYLLKEKIKSFLGKSGYKTEDVGTYSEESCDYPLFGYEAARKVSEKKAGKGILICKSGIGMSIVGNKLPGVRAALCVSKGDAVSAREHNDANVLVLSSTKAPSSKALEIVKIWLATKALGGRHARRVRQIIELEKKLYK